jgi:hypothetical protein
MPSYPASLEPLEARIAPATFTVTTTADAGAGSLRQAIVDANATADADIIAFTIGGAGVQTIALATPLPSIVQPLTIDGTTQTGYVAGGAPLIELTGAGLPGGSHGLVVSAADTRIAALAIGQFPGSGILLASTGATVERSYLGTTAAGSAAAGNGVGISITGAQNLVGGLDAGLGNLISGNIGAGVVLTGAGATGNILLRNVIGIAVNLNDFLPNAVGILIEPNASGNFIGGSSPGLGNDIGGNTGAGIAIVNSTLSTGNALRGNNVSGNGGLGIDLFNNGPTANDLTAPFAHQNFPSLTEALAGGGRTLIRGTLTSTASSAFEVQFFGNVPAEQDPSGFGEGRQFLGSAFVTTDSTGVASFSAPIPFAVTAGNFVTATAIDIAGNTSEFSANLLVGDGLRAPVIAANGRSATFTDADGDRVTVLVSKGRLDPADFTLVAAGPGNGAQLLALNFSDDGAEFSGANVTLVAKRTSLGGDGFVNLGYLNAAGVNLGVVKVAGDLGRIDAGAGQVGVLALRSLSAQSMGRYSGDTDIAGNPLSSVVNGHTGTVAIAADFIGPVLSITGNLATLSIGRNIIGIDATLPGSIFVDGRIFKARIGGDINGGDTLSTGRLSAGSFGEVTVGGSVLGGTGNSSGAITAETGGIDKLVIRGSLIGSPDAALADANGTVRAAGTIGSMSVGRDLIGGSAESSGYVFANAIGTITVGGSINGGPVFFSGGIEASTTIGLVSIRGSLFGAAGERSGAIFSNTGLGRVIVSGSLEGGAGNGSASIDSGGGIGSVQIGDSARGGAGAFSGAITAAGRIGAASFGGTLETAVASLATVGSVSVRGDFFGLIGARGTLNPATTAAALAIGKVSVGGSFSGAIFAGWSFSAGWTNPDVHIGSILVSGNAGTIRVSAGIDPGANGAVADHDDFVAAGGSGSILSQIGSIVVRGQVGRSELGTHLGFTAQHIGKLQIGSVVFPLTSGTDRFDLGILGNVSLREA